MKSRAGAGALFGVCLALTAVAVFAYSFGALKSLELASVDKRFGIAREAKTPQDVVLVAIDDTTFFELPQVQWPYPRDFHARVIDELTAANARAIAYDVQFTEPSDDPAADQELVEAVDRATNVVLATTETDGNGGTRVLGGNETLDAIGAHAGHSDFPVDGDGVIRRVSHERDGLTAFSIAAVEAGEGRELPASDFKDNGSAWIDFAGPPGQVKTVSYSRVLNGKIPASTFRDKYVVVGAAHTSLQDYHQVPTGRSPQMAGPEIQANAIATALADFPLSKIGFVWSVLLIVLLGLVPPFAGLRGGAIAIFGVSLVAGLIYTGITLLAFNLGLIIPYVYPMIALGLSAIGALGAILQRESFERQRVRDVFARYVNDAVVGELLEETGGTIKLGGHRMHTTVLFSDLRGFTTFSENLPPEEVIEILNRYLNEMSDAILDHGGTLVSYMGDGIMAVFGAPIEQQDHADRAVAASRDMLTGLARFNDWLREEKGMEPFRMGIGLNTGFVMSGNVGSQRRFEYTAIGDTTNTGARLEGATKNFDYQLLLADSTREALSAEPADLVMVGEIPIRGREHDVRVWSLEAFSKTMNSNGGSTAAGRATSPLQSNLGSAERNESVGANTGGTA